MNRMAGTKSAREINNLIRYTAWSVFRTARPLGDVDRQPLTA
jgi:hydrogen peroxide-dependent heme synthase